MCNRYLTGVQGFRLEFVFAKNPFFTNEVLAKEYHFAAGTDGDSTHYLDHTTVAQPIAWIAGKDLTKRQVKRTVVARRTGALCLASRVSSSLTPS